eukprot:gene8368-8188_t
MALITLINAQLAFGHVALLDHAGFSLEQTERVGLIGRNGAGKSSLLKILGGLAKPDDGSLQVQQGVRIAYVAQEPILDAEATIFQAASAGLQRVIAIREQYLAAEEGVDLDALQSEIEAFDAWNWEQRKEEQLAQEAVIAAKADKLLAQEEVWIRKGVEARRTRSQSRISRLEALRQRREARRDVVGSVKMDVATGSGNGYQGKIVAELTDVGKAFGSKQIGSIRQGANLQIAYFDQMRHAINLDATLEDFISPGSEWIEIGNQRKHVKSYLSDF